MNDAPEPPISPGSLLEGDAFEPPVPRGIDHNLKLSFLIVVEPVRVLPRGPTIRDRSFESISLQRRVRSPRKRSSLDRSVRLQKRTAVDPDDRSGGAAAAAAIISSVRPGTKPV